MKTGPWPPEAVAVKPFSPADALASKATVIPEPVVTAVNQLLAERYTGRSKVTFTLKELKARVMRNLDINEDDGGPGPALNYPNYVWDFETLYQGHGWDVKYDAPGYNESYDGFYVFKKVDPSW
jgi:hypothetical protein